MTELLFTPARIGGQTLSNRMVMAPMTRGRSDNGVPTESMARYYAARAAAGLIVSEATAISPEGHGWNGAPGIFTDAQERGWKQVTEAVHQSGGAIYLQLWHMGRVSHPDFQPGGALPLGPSAVAAKGDAHTPQGTKPYVTPRVMTEDDIARTVRDYANAAKRAIAAGFDGVEIHGANGYLIDQFLRSGSNRRTDRYGGGIENRMRFLKEVAEAIVAEVGADKVGVRISPLNAYNDMRDDDPKALFTAVGEMLNPFGLAYLHVLEALPGHPMHGEGGPVAPRIRSVFRGPLMLNGGYDKQAAERALEANEADMIAFGVPFLANPDLVERFRHGWSLNTPDVSTFYSPGERGYNDYPEFRKEAA